MDRPPNSRVARPVLLGSFSDRPGLHRRQARTYLLGSFSDRPGLHRRQARGESRDSLRRRRYRSRPRRIRCGNSLGPTRAENRHHRTQVLGWRLPQRRLHPSKALLRNAELAHIFHKEAATFGISSSASFDFGAAFDRSRKVAEGRVAGVHYLMKKNGITEIHGYGTFVDANSLSVALNDGGTETVTFDNAIIATGSSTVSVPGTSLSKNVVTYEEQILSRDLPRVDRHRAQARSVWNRLRSEELRRRRHHRRIPPARTPNEGRRGLQRD